MNLLEAFDSRRLFPGFFYKIEVYGDLKFRYVGYVNDRIDGRHSSYILVFDCSGAYCAFPLSDDSSDCSLLKISECDMLECL